MHGTKPEMTQDFVRVAAQSKPIAMLCEGTNMIGGDFSTEDEVREKMGKIVSSTKSLVLATFRHTDVDRTRTLYEVAKKYGRKLAVSLRQAYVLNKLKEDKHLDLPPVDSSNFLIFKREKKQYYKWEQTVLGLGNVVDAHEIKRMQNGVILATALSDLKELLEIRPDSGSSFVLSSSEPFNEEMELEYEKFVNWLDHFGLPMFHVHCSGHVMPTEVRQVIERISPKTLFPIHTEHPDLFARFVSNVANIRLPERNKTVEIA
jgi:ribonuclease J